MDANSHPQIHHRGALHWIIDQYQVSEDKRSGIVGDPNRDDGQEYIVGLIGQVGKVSLGSVRALQALPVDYTASPASP